MIEQISRICVYCASSTQADRKYSEAARRLGALLAQHSITIIYGGGMVGSMGALADGALARGGQVIGIIPEFMHDLEWGHPEITELRVVGDMHTRKRTMMEESDAIIALPGGTGTMEELLEAITWKRLGMYLNPIVLVNVAGFYSPLIQMLNHSIDEHFMDMRHREMWSVVDSVDAVPDALRSAPDWHAENRNFAAI